MHVEEAAGIKESASKASPSSETWLSVRWWTTEEITRKGLLSLLEIMMDTPSTTGDDLLRKRYKNTFVLMLTQQKL